MSLGARAVETSRALYARAPEKSLVPTALAVDTTARRRYPRQRSNRERYTRFLREEMRLITTVWLGRALDVCRIAAVLPGVAPESEDGAIGLDELLYYIMRAEILREPGTARGVLTAARGIEQLAYGGENRTVLRVSHRLIEGCLAAVVLAPQNGNERTPEPVPLYIRSRRYWINRLWGRRDYFGSEVLGVDLRDAAARGEPPVAELLVPGRP